MSLTENHVILSTARVPCLTHSLSLVFIYFVDDDGQNTWPDILKFLFQCAASQDPQLKQSALYIFR